MTKPALAEDHTRPVVDDLHRVREQFRSIQARAEDLARELRRDPSRRTMRIALTELNRRFEQLLDDVKRMTAAARLPDSLEQVERTAQIASVAEIAASLQKHLGQRVTAYLSGVKDPKMVGRWARGTVKPREVAELRLRAAYPAAELLVDAYGPDTARAWFFGTNTRLGDEAPAHLLRHGEPPFRGLLPAARAFVQGDVN